MTKKSEEFLNSFNRLEKWMKDQLDNPQNIGFSELVRRLSKQKKSTVAEYADDLLQFAQLRNAIVHERIAEDFIIAEPNEWAVKRILLIESQLTKPPQVLPRFAKHVTGFEKNIPLMNILEIVADKRYSQFPIFSNGEFIGLLTLRLLGYWLAVESQNGSVELRNKTAADVLLPGGKSVNYAFVTERTFIFQVEEMFRNQATLDAVLITRDGNPNGKILGIIRPRDIYHRED